MAYELHRAESRGVAEHGWLSSRHSFSFANYYNPKRMGFGTLRVINDDIVAPGEGFPTHPHKNMEIISIPLSGALKHGDSMGHEQVIRCGEVQVMSAGSGILHSEFNASLEAEVRFLQIWIIPSLTDISPCYNQHDFSAEMPRHGVLPMVGPQQAALPLAMTQNAYVSMACLDAGALAYRRFRPDNGVYFFVLEGPVMIAEKLLESRDALGVTDADEIALSSEGQVRVLCLEVPMMPPA